MERPRPPEPPNHRIAYQSINLGEVLLVMFILGVIVLITSYSIRGNTPSEGTYIIMDKGVDDTTLKIIACNQEADCITIVPKTLNEWIDTEIGDERTFVEGRRL